ncbi:o-succinylbenzoate--CoA ligase [Haloechinothrix halophila]|uniref:Acyl-CoA synthetase (AMP-forming)/AMP-acid ligase II n=1 Tax=Haloechinothrix halophila YIM 93223 TaxID=592678 RepID=W9DS30_9PSEU|nr:o-succinylbenzoate--CoA ligase [Haloechinothrix halophila]ETA66497.1 acyl-CoA synthetase (AMP-forming)/AMP-acid ligase II [Haloechinothrix halophila YIM 93223]
MNVVEVDGTPDAARRLMRALTDALDGGDTVLPLAANTPDAEPPPDAPSSAAAVIRTSGSTGTPKDVLLSARALTASATATHARLGGPGHWLLATPAHYIGGLQVLVRSLLAGTEPGVLDLSSGFQPEAFAQVSKALPGEGPRYTALVPTQLARLLDAGQADAAASFDAIIIGGAALPTGLRERAEDNGVRVISAYGMSETAGGCVYDGVPLDGVRVATDAPTEAGRVRLTGPILADGYLNDDAETSAAFRDGWFHTNDLGRISPDGRLEILGRADDVINTGGVKVAAHAVADALLSHRGVRDACVVGLQDPDWGEAVVAAVVPHDPERPPAPDDLTAHVRTALGAPSAPKRVRFVAELPLRGPGKPDHDAVRRLLRS